MNATTPTTGRPPPLKILTPAFRLSFPHVLTPTSDPQHPEKGQWYELTALFPKNAAGLDVLRNAIAQAKARGLAEALWGRWPDGRPVEPWTSAGTVFHMPVRDADKDPKKAVMDGYKGHYFMKMKSAGDKRPGVVDANMQPIMQAADLYPGCWCRATCVFYPFNKNGGQGIAVSLHNLQKLKDDTPFGNRARPEDDFGQGVPSEFAPQGGGDFDNAPAAPAPTQRPAAPPRQDEPAF